MRNLTASMIRRPRPTSLIRLLHVWANACDSPSSSSSSSSRSLVSSQSLTISSHDNCNRWFSPTRSPNSSLGLSRNFSTEADFLDPNESILPVRFLTSLLDFYHDHSGFPWWLVISSSTVVTRMAMFPFVVIQRRKLKRIAELMHKLPPPFPPPLSGRSWRDQFSIFLKEKKAAGCPSHLWIIASFAVQVPCFLLWIVTIRTMSLAHHTGFDFGGALWFQNLTEYPQGVLGPMFPLSIAGLHYINSQMSFKSSLENSPGALGSLAKCYKTYLQLLTLPIMFATFSVPQGSLVYWLTNSSLTLLQQICLSNPNVLDYLGLSNKKVLFESSSDKESVGKGVPDVILSTKQKRTSARSLPPGDLVSLSIKALGDGRTDAAMNLLRLALEKDPAHARALLTMGQILLQQQKLVDATELLESAVSKLTALDCPTESEQVDLLILSSLWAGIANVRQGKTSEGLVHLERIARLEEPHDPKIKAHYYDLLLVLSSVLVNMDRKAEAIKYLQKAVAYDSAYATYLKDVENDSTGDNLTANSRGNI